jgi:hypothetical protein
MAEPLIFRVGTEAEFEAIHRLNYRTFVEEIPQHEPNSEHRLVDKFHDQNTYLVAMRGDRLVGMMAVRNERPFSLDQKVPNLDSYLPPGRVPCEVRLLAVLPGERRGRVFWGLLRLVYEHIVARGWDLAVSSCTTRQLKLYTHIGFVPFGPLVGTAKAPFQPMYITVEAYENATRELEAKTQFGVGLAKRSRTLPATG